MISNMLFWLSNGMLIPDIIFLLFFFIKALLMIGGFYGTYIARTKINVKLNREIGKTGVEEFLDTLPEGNGKSKLLEYLRKIKAAPQDRALREKLLGDYEIAADKELGQSKLLVKIGPMLGLMGTLIPMGPALVGLATGDIGSMAYNMQVAFATTVVGIVIGAIGFITLQVKQRWVADDMNILEYVVESLNEKE
ncbi:MAG: MotA/TolQ/ExbB proton channel family protein [Tidjanibacter sp.]|nr:MotA/TolQ/ExbB proton channel family protein [Tidjanibacter sp.]